ncbi:MAG: hypothetical protein NTZ12_04965 [Candidatus Aminicenantes bacterium]|nr:hypothetical protein [Candidatus Aminicenantes bacterium]
MEKIKRTIHPVVALVVLLIISCSLPAQFKKLETDTLRLIYFPIESFLTSHTVSSFVSAFRLHQKLFDYQPSEKITILLHDFGDYANAAAGSVPQNTIIAGIAPSSYVFETMPATERINAIMQHELVHILTSDKAARADRFFRSLFFGKVTPSEDNPLTMLYGYLTTPRLYVPRWFMEGIAVFMETWMSGGYGRLLGCYDEMVFRTLVNENSRIYDLVGLESAGTRLDFQVGAISYLYGTRFFGYLGLRYGPESVINWVSRRDGSRAYFSAQFKKVFGLPLARAWTEWIAWEREFQKANLETIRSSPLTPFRDISARVLGSVSPAFYDARRGKIFLGVNYPGQVAHLASLDLQSGSMRKLCDVKGPALYYVCSLAYDVETGTLFYTADNNAWRDLRQVQVDSGRTRLLIKDGRIGDLAFNRRDRSLWGIRHYNGISTIVRIEPPYREWKQVYSWPYGKDIYDIAISPDGRWLAAALTEISGRQSLIKIELEKLSVDNAPFTTVSDFENSSPANFVFAEDGRSLYGSSYYSGVSNIYRCDLDGENVEILTNCETGFFRPVPLGSDSLLVFRYTADGFRPTVISSLRPDDLKVKAITMLGQQVSEQHPQVRDWVAERPGLIDPEPLIISRGSYTPLKNIGLKSIYPVVEGYKDVAAFGLNFHLADKVSLEKMDLSVTYSPGGDLEAKERFHLRLQVALKNWELIASHNVANFYDLFGPTRTSRKGQSLELRYSKNLIYDEPNRFLDYSIQAAGYFGLERLPDYQNVSISQDRFFTLDGKLNYKYLRKSLAAIEDEKGYQYRLVLGNTYVNRTLYPRLYGCLDYGLPLPIKHSSLWWRGAAGIAIGDRQDPFANFYFGGFGNNWVDHQDSKRYREYYSFPGVDLNELAGKNFAKLTLEWNLPPLFFRRLGFPFFYANWISPSLFCTGLLTNMDSRPDRRRLYDVGAQFDIRLIALSHHQLTLSLGYARAYEAGRDAAAEWMVSLKI